MIENLQVEQLLLAWVKLSGLVKNNSITKGLPYNEAIVMLMLHNRHSEDGVGLVSVQEIIRETGMLKSQVNRTVNSLEEKGLLERATGEQDKRILFVKCVQNKLDVFLEVHQASLKVAGEIAAIIGEEDTGNFIRIVQKLADAGYKL